MLKLPLLETLVTQKRRELEEFRQELITFKQTFNAIRQRYYDYVELNAQNELKWHRRDLELAKLDGRFKRVDYVKIAKNERKQRQLKRAEDAKKVVTKMFKEMDKDEKEAFLQALEE